MPGFIKRVTLHNLRTHQDESADIVRLDRAFARDRIDARWWTEPWITRITRAKIRKEAGDRHWQWKKIVRKFELTRGWMGASLGVVTSDGEVQGAISFDPNVRSLLSQNEGTTYVEYVAAAPRNRTNLTPVPLYNGVGSALLLIAMYYSLKAGHRGRLTLYPLSNVVSWYTGRHKFVDTRIRYRYPDRTSLELRPEDADRALAAFKYEEDHLWLPA